MNHAAYRIKIKGFKDVVQKWTIEIDSRPCGYSSNDAFLYIMFLLDMKLQLCNIMFKRQP